MEGWIERLYAEASERFRIATKGLSAAEGGGGEALKLAIK